MPNTMTDSEYLRYLKHERRMLAWCMIHFGHMESATAEKYAEEFYPFENEGHGRGFKFHRLAWSWAMRELFGSDYHLKAPSLAQPSQEYLDFSETVRSQTELD